jgi:mannose/cellobiose epimerase-like protein (N-acyl-D-glucosamine 2-epimerase family)
LSVHCRQDDSLAQLPCGADWLRHVREDLMPFWSGPEALGQPVGNFPTFRCNDGSLPDLERLPPEYVTADPFIRKGLGREYTRMKSRQTFAYGVAFHLTGEPQYLDWARAGVEFLRRQAYEQDSGSAITYWEQGEPGPPLLQRTSQDLAYAQVGLAFYYYLTRDEAVLADLVRLKEYLFSNYYIPEWDLLAWTREANPEDPGDPPDTQRRELVAQLDQINAYLLLLTPLLPDALRPQWEEDLRRLVRSILTQFYSEEHQLFWGTLHHPRALGTPHTDYGHTIKALWMTYLVARMLGDRDLEVFAAATGGAVLKRAYLPDAGAWSSRPRQDGSNDEEKEWWIFAELDQMAATLALRDPEMLHYLGNTYRFWQMQFVDPVYHEVWTVLRGADHRPWLPKAHLWKNGYHSLEHALVGYITTKALRGEPATLHYAFPAATAASTIHPYFFRGRMVDRQATFSGHSLSNHTTVSFEVIA